MRARPTAIPGETPTPTSSKRRLLLRLLALAEPAADELAEALGCLDLVVTFSDDLENCALTRRQQEDTEDGFAIHGPAVPCDGDPGTEAGRELDEARSSSGVEPQSIGDDDLATGHCPVFPSKLARNHDGASPLVTHRTSDFRQGRPSRRARAP